MAGGPIKNAAYTFSVALVAQASRPSFKADPTLASGDFKVSKDGGAFADLASLPTIAPAAGRNVEVALSADEMNADRVVVQCVDAAGAEWDDVMVSIETETANLTTVSARVPAALVSGRMDSSVGAMAANVITASATAADYLAEINAEADTALSDYGALKPTVAGRTLDVSAGGEAGVDWANVGSPTTTVGLTNTTVGVVTLVNTLTTYTGNTVQTGDAFARLGAPAGASVSADIAAIEAQTDDIGTAGAGLTAVPWNAAWDAEVQSEVQDAIEINNLDHLLKVAAVAGDAVDSSIIARLASKSATPSFASFVNTTDSLEAVRDNMPTVTSGGVTLANGVTHGGTTALMRLGSNSSDTPALYITNDAEGDAVKFECTVISADGSALNLVGQRAGLRITGNASYYSILCLAPVDLWNVGIGTLTCTTGINTGGLTITGGFLATHTSNDIRGIDVNKISGDATAADNLEAILDGTGGTGLTLSTITTSGTVTLNALTVSAATTFTGAVLATHASNDIRGIKLAATGLAAVTSWTVDMTGTVSGNATAAQGTAIKAKTDLLTFTVSGVLDSNVQYVNDVQVSGTGQSGNEWGPA